METPDSILAKFDELIADLSADSARDKRETHDAEVEAEHEAARKAEADAQRNAALESASGEEREPAPDEEADVELHDEADDEPDPASDGESDLNLDVEPEAELKDEPEPEAKPKSKPAAKTKAKPETAKPETAKPGTAKPETAKPETAKPETAKPETAKPEVAKVKPAIKRRKVVDDDRESVLEVKGLTKIFGDTTAVAGVDLTVKAGTIFGIVGPNGAGKTTTLSMITGLLRPDSGTVTVHGEDVWTNPALAKRYMGVLPDRLRLFERLTGSQLLYYAGVLRGIPKWTVRERMWQLATALGFEEALGRLVADYSAGMTKKITLAAALIHSPRLLVLDEPFESVDPVSVASIVDILTKFVESGGSVVLSSHSMDLIQRMCDSVAIIVGGEVLDTGTVDEVRGEGSLEERFIELAGGVTVSEGLEWLHSFSD